MTEYRSKKDLWISIVLLLSSLMTLFVMVVIFWTEGSLLFKILMFALLGLVLAICLGGYTFTIYGLTDEALHIRMGLFRWAIPLTSIEEARLSDKLIPGLGISLALSIKKVGIMRKDGRWPVYISPAHREAFIEDISRRIQNLNG